MGGWEKRPQDGPWSWPSSGPPQGELGTWACSRPFPAPSLGSRVCPAWGSEGRGRKGRTQKLWATKKCLTLGPMILAPSSVHIPYCYFLAQLLLAPEPGSSRADSDVSLPPLLSHSESLSRVPATCQVLGYGVKKGPVIIWRSYPSVT